MGRQRRSVSHPLTTLRTAACGLRGLRPSIQHMKLVAVVATVAVALGANPAFALCIYNGEDNAKTTTAQEFKDSKWVVRAKVVAAKDHFSDEEESWTLYQLDVRHSFKGHPPRRLRFFTTRDSGGFYMDKAWVRLPAGHDIGGEYLLFLNPWPTRSDLPPQAQDAVFVNYNCGMSRLWREVSPAARKQLSALEQIP